MDIRPWEGNLLVERVILYFETSFDEYKSSKQKIKI